MSEARLAAVLLGPPGAGKSTQVRRVAARLGWTAVDFGHLVRSAVRAGTPLGARVEAHRRARGDGPVRRSGAWLPDPLCRDLLEAHLRAGPPRPGALFDGYPRLLAQAAFLDAPGWRLVAAVHLVVSEAEGRRRLAGRVVDGATGAVARADGSPPPAGGAWARRPEDAPESLAARLADWARDTRPLLERYRVRGELVEVDGTGPEEAVAARVADAIRERRP